jgi:hypothetical protein
MQISAQDKKCRGYCITIIFSSHSPACKAVLSVKSGYLSEPCSSVRFLIKHLHHDFVIYTKENRKQKLKTEKTENMKTRILSSTLVLLLAVASSAFATGTVHNSSVASGHENTTTQLSAIQNLDIPAAESVTIEDWIGNLDGWEQEGQAAETLTLNCSVTMEEWMTNLDNWEQGEELEMGNNLTVQTSLLNEWIASAENWEQR